MKLLYVKFVCVKLLYVKFVCVKLLSVKFVCVKFVCVKLLYVKFVCVVLRRRREEEEKPGIQNQKQEPHTKMWGTKNPPFFSINALIPLSFLQHPWVGPGTPPGSLGRAAWF